MLKTLLSALIAPLLMVLWVSNVYSEPIRIQNAPEIKSRFAYNFWKKHDRGFVVNLDVGLGYASVMMPNTRPPKEGEEVKNTAKSAGVAGLFALDLGWMVVENTSVHGSIFGALTTEDGLIGVGPSVRYWFGDSGWYVGVATGPMTVQVTSQKVDYFKKWTWAVQANVGLSTWLSNHTHGSIKVVGGISGLDFVSAPGVSMWWVGASLSFGLN